MLRAHWQDRIEVLLGLWLVACPFVLSFPLQSAAWSAIVAGVCVVLLSLETFFVPDLVEEWGNLAVGIALMVSPWLFGYASDTTALTNAVGAGLAIAGLSFWAVEDIHHEQLQSSSR